MSLRIVSASRRTDIPALYGDWFMNRVRAGWCAVPNPLNSKQVSRVDFVPGETVIVFWTRWPAPFLRHLDALSARGYPFYFLYTLVDYPRPLEPHAPTCQRSLEVFLRLSERLGPERVIWRYDPIVLSEAMDADFHRERFARIAERLRGATRRVTISIMDDYSKMRGRLRALVAAHPELAPRAFVAERDGTLIGDLAQLAQAHGMAMQGCAEEIDLQPWGVAPGKCIDDDLIRQLFALKAPGRKDKSQRPVCGCVESRDIGMYDSCTFGCVYCYATRSFDTARRQRAGHDPMAESLIGHFRAPTSANRLRKTASGVPIQGDLFG
ncbi:DUF1848 domain-containing protein [Thiorhodovibrio winogradskyi]|uniref:DUF1848 domain-containing protein n=1 Tax=Thiorhodovibrio winogradskyi TaxID=77007 RepID=UPI002E2CFCA6|nr:DUF1848 domain-containing protein [Thiorhodovibrio winogradskyi]